MDNHWTSAAEGKIADVQVTFILDCLGAALDTNPAVRIAAENCLKEASASKTPGYGLALLTVTVNQQFSSESRQLAAVLLKQHVKHHWHERDASSVPPVVSPEEKVAIRHLFPTALEDPRETIRTEVGIAIAAIAINDWPEQWPSLMLFLTGSLSDQCNKNKVHGASRCLALFAEDLDLHDLRLKHLVSELFPALHSVVSASNVLDFYIRRRALVVLNSYTSRNWELEGVSEMRASMAEMLQPWSDHFAKILSLPLQAGDANDWWLRIEVVKSLQKIVKSYPGIAAEFPLVLSSLCQIFISGYTVYTGACMQSEQEFPNASTDSDGCDQSFEAFILQLFESLHAAVHVSTSSFLEFKENMKDLVYYTIGYLQMTKREEDNWSVDPSQYVKLDDEDATSKCRIAGILLLKRLLERHEERALQAIVEACHRRILESQKEKLEGRQYWWKLREAAVLAMGSVAESLIKAQTHGGKGIRLEEFVEEGLIEGIEGKGMQLCPFLFRQVLSVAAKFASEMDSSRSKQFFHAALMGLTQSTPAPVKVGACRALRKFLSQVNSSYLQQYSTTVFLALADFLEKASEGSLHLILILGTLRSAAKADNRAFATMESRISTVVLKVWVSHFPDPYVRKLVSLEGNDTN